MENRYKTIAWDVDTQRDFMEDGNNCLGYVGKLAVLDEKGNPRGAMHLETALKGLVEYLHTRKIPIMGSMDWHDENAAEFAENPDFVNTFPPHCIKDTYGVENVDVTTKQDPLYVEHDFTYNNRGDDLVNRIRSHIDEVVFRKDNFDVFAQNGGNPYAAKVLRDLGVERAIVYGVATDVCVNFAVQGLQKLGIEVYAISDTMAGVTPAGHFATLDKWREQGVNVIKLEELVKLDLR